MALRLLLLVVSVSLTAVARAVDVRFHIINLDGEICIRTWDSHDHNYIRGDFYSPYCSLYRYYSRATQGTDGRWTPDETSLIATETYRQWGAWSDQNPVRNYIMNNCAEGDVIYVTYETYPEGEAPYTRDLRSLEWNITLREGHMAVGDDDVVGCYKKLRESALLWTGVRDATAQFTFVSADSEGRFDPYNLRIHPVSNPDMVLGFAGDLTWKENTIGHIEAVDPATCGATRFALTRNNNSPANMRNGAMYQAPDSASTYKVVLTEPDVAEAQEVGSSSKGKPHHYLFYATDERNGRNLYMRGVAHGWSGNGSDYTCFLSRDYDTDYIFVRYYVVNKQGEVATWYTGRLLSGEAPRVPDNIKSVLLDYGQYHYWLNDGVNLRQDLTQGRQQWRWTDGVKTWNNDASTIDDTRPLGKFTVTGTAELTAITTDIATRDDGGNWAVDVYVTYDDYAGDKVINTVPVKLDGTVAYGIYSRSWNRRYLSSRDADNNMWIDASTTNGDLLCDAHVQWYLYAPDDDPYNIRLINRAGGVERMVYSESMGVSNGNKRLYLGDQATYDASTGEVKSFALTDGRTSSNPTVHYITLLGTYIGGTGAEESTRYWSRMPYFGVWNDGGRMNANMKNFGDRWYCVNNDIEFELCQTEEKTVTWHVLDLAGHEAIRYTTSHERGMALTRASMPADVRSPLVQEGQYRFYSAAPAQLGTDAGDHGRRLYDRAHPDEGKRITQVGDYVDDIWVIYDYDAASSPVDLSGSGPDYYLHYHDGYMMWGRLGAQLQNQSFDPATNWNALSCVPDEGIYPNFRDFSYYEALQWRLVGDDPYDIQIYSPVFGYTYKVVGDATNTWMTNNPGDSDNRGDRYHRFILTETASGAWQIMAACRDDRSNRHLYIRRVHNESRFIFSNPDDASVRLPANSDVEGLRMTLEPVINYHVVTLSHKASIWGGGSPGTAGVDAPLRMPDVILSPLMEQGDFRYYLRSQFDEAQLAQGLYVLKDGEADRDVKTTGDLPAGTSDVYALYTYDNAGRRINLDGTVPYTIYSPDRGSDKRQYYWYASINASDNVAYKYNNPSSAQLKTDAYKWYLTGGGGVPDPYDIRFVNSQRGTWATATWSTVIADNSNDHQLLLNSDTEAKATSFVLLRNAATEADEHVYQLAAAVPTVSTDFASQGKGHLAYVTRWWNDREKLTNWMINVHNGYRLKIDDVSDYTFHLTTKVGGRVFTAQDSGIEGDAIQIPPEMQRRFAVYTFYSDPELTQPLTVYPGSNSASHDIWVDYTVPDFETADGETYNVFSADYDHAYWFVIMYHPWGHNCYLQVKDGDADPANRNGLYSIFRYEDNSAVKVWPGDAYDNARDLFAFIGDPYDTKVINRMTGAGMVMGIRDDEAVASAVMGFYPEGEKRYETWEMRLSGGASGPSADDLRRDNFWTRLCPAGTDLTFNNWWQSNLRVPLTSPAATGGATHELQYVPDRADVSIHIYDAQKGLASATQVHQSDYVDLQAYYKARRLVDFIPDSLLIPGLRYTYYATEADLLADTGGCDDVADLGIVGPRPSHDPAVPRVATVQHVWMSFTVTDDYPIAFSNPGEKTRWYFITYQNAAQDYGWTTAEADANDHFPRLLKWDTRYATQKVTDQRLLSADISVDHKLLDEPSALAAATRLSDAADATRIPACYLWKFVGNPYAFRIYNRKAGTSKTLAADNLERTGWSNRVSMVDAGSRQFDQWQLSVTRHTEHARAYGTGDDEEPPHVTLRLAANNKMYWGSSIDQNGMTPTLYAVNNSSDSRHIDCIRLYDYVHKTYYNGRIHLKNLTTGLVTDIFVARDDLELYLEQTLTGATLPESVRRQFCDYILYHDPAYTDATASLDFEEAYTLFTDADGNVLDRDYYWDAANEAIDQDAEIYIDIYVSYTVDPEATVRFYPTVDDLMAADPASAGTWNFLQMGVGEAHGHYYTAEGELPAGQTLTPAERPFLDRAASRGLNFLCRGGDMTPADTYGVQQAMGGNETVTSVGGPRYFPSTDSVHSVQLLSPRCDFRRVAETFRDSIDADFRESRWLWGFVGDPYAFKLINREAPTKRLVSDVCAVVDSIYDVYIDGVQVTSKTSVLRKVGDIRLSTSPLDGGAHDLWEMRTADDDAPGAFRFKVVGVNQWLCAADAGNPTLIHERRTAGERDKGYRSLIAHPWGWSDGKYKRVRVRLWRDTTDGEPVLTQTFTPAERIFMAGDVVDGSLGHFFLPHEGDANYDAALADGHLIDIPFELRRRFCTYEVVGGSFTVADTDAEQTLDIIYHVQRPDADHPFIPRFLDEGELAAFRAVGDNDPFVNSRGETLAKSDYYYFLDIGNTLGYHALINPDQPRMGLKDREKMHPYDVVDNRFMRSDPTQLQWFFVGDPYSLRLMNVYFSNHKGEQYRDKEFNLARNYHRNNYPGEYGDGEAFFNLAYMEEVDPDVQQPNAPHGKVYWEMVEARRDPSTGHYYDATDPNVAYRYDRIRDLPFALRLTKPHSMDYPDEATAAAHPDDDAYKTHLGRGTAFYLTNTAYGKGQSETPYNYSTWGYSLYHYRAGKTNPRGNEIEDALMTFPDVRHRANMNPSNDGTSSLFTAMPVGRVYVTVYDHEDLSTKVTDYELSDFYAITERFRGVPSNLQRQFCDYTKISEREDMAGGSIADADGYVEVDKGMAHLYATYRETSDAPFCMASASGDLVLTDALGRPSATSVAPWQNMKVGTAWAFFNSNFRGFDYEDGTENDHRVDLNSGKYGDGNILNHGSDISAAWATSADDWRFRKGFSWALIGDPYHFTLRNKRDVTIGQGDKVDGEYERYATSPAYLTDETHVLQDVNGQDSIVWRLRIGGESDALAWTLMRDAAYMRNSDAHRAYFLSESDRRRTEVAGPVNGAYASTLYSKADQSRDVWQSGKDDKIALAAVVPDRLNPTNYDLGSHVILQPSEYVKYPDGTDNGGAGNEGFDAIVSVYNRINEMVATTGWTELSRKRSEWSLDNNLPADVRRWSCIYHLWADPTMTTTPFHSYQDVGDDGEYLIKDGGTVYVTYDYDEAIFSTENEYRWVNPFFNWDDTHKTWPLHDDEVYRYTAEQWDYSVKEGGTERKYILPEANVRQQQVRRYWSDDDPTIPYRETKEGWMESPAADNLADSIMTNRAYAFSSHQYKSRTRYIKDGEWDDLTPAEQAERADEDMKVQKWALIGDPYKFILYNYYRRADAYNLDQNAYYLQYKDGQIINAKLPETDRQVADGEAPVSVYDKETLQGVYWTWKVDGTGYTYRKRNPDVTDEEVETWNGIDSSPCETSGQCSVRLRDTFYETDADGRSTGELKAGYLAVCDMKASSLYDKSRLVGSVQGYVTFARQTEQIVTLDGHVSDVDDFEFNLYQDAAGGGRTRQTYSVARGASTPIIGAAYTVGFNDKYKGYIHYDASRHKGGIVTLTFDAIGADGRPIYERNYYYQPGSDDPDAPNPANDQWVNFASWRDKYGIKTYTYIHYEGTPGGEYDAGTEMTGRYYDGGGEGERLPIYLDGTEATLGPEPERDTITYKKVQVLSGVAPKHQYLTLTGGPSDVESHLNLGRNGSRAYRFLVTTMPIHASSVTFHLDPEDHGLETAGRTSKRNFATDPIYDHTTEDYGIGNDLMLPWLMRRQYCNYTYYVEAIADDYDATHVDDLQYVKGQYNRGRLDSRGTDYEKFWSKNVTTPLAPSPSGGVEVPEAWEDKHVYVRVTYEPDPDRWQASDWSRHDPDDVHWYNLMTQKADDMPQYLMQYTRSRLVRGSGPDLQGHTTNDYLWAVEGDPYGFWVHNRYAAHWHNGTSADGGATWPEANERWDDAVLTTDHVNSRELHNYGASDDVGEPVAASGRFTEVNTVNDAGEVTGTRPEYQADIRFADAAANAPGRMLSDKARPDTTLAAASHRPEQYRLWEALTGNYRSAMMLHAVKAPVNTRDENGIKYYTSYLFNGVNWPVQQNYLQEWQAMRNVYCNWVLTLPSAAQLLPYWERAGYGLALQPEVALAPQPVALYADAQAYDDRQQLGVAALTDCDVDLYAALTAIRDGKADASGYLDPTRRYGMANIDLVLKAARRVAHHPRNLVRMEPELGGLWRLQAYSSYLSPAADAARRPAVASMLRRLGADRFASAPLHRGEADVASAAGLPLHFYASMDVGRTFDDLLTEAASRYGQGAATTYRRAADAALLGLPPAGAEGEANAYNATRGQQTVEAADFDPSAIFRLRAPAAESDALRHRYWQMQAQGLNPGEGIYVQGLDSGADGGSGLDTGSGSAVSPSATVGTALASAFGGASLSQLDIQDIGVTAVQVQPRAAYAAKECRDPATGTERTDDERADEGTDYLSYDPQSAYWAAKAGDELGMTTDSIYHTRWLLQPIGDEAFNVAGVCYRRPLCLRLYADRQTGGQYWYGSLLMPFDVELQEGALAYVPEAPKPIVVDGVKTYYVPTRLIGRKEVTKRGHRFVPGGIGVVVRVAADDAHVRLGADGRQYRYATLSLPNVDPSTALADEIRQVRDDATNPSQINAAPASRGVLLEQVLTRGQAPDAASGLGEGPAEGQAVYVFGQYQMADGTYSPVGFYPNANHDWYADPDFATLEPEWYRRDDPTDWDRDNLYVRHNRVYLFYDAPASGASSDPSASDPSGKAPALTRVLPIHFDGEPEPGAIERRPSSVPQWYTLGGIHLRRRPTQPGVYIYGGRKVMVE